MCKNLSRFLALQYSLHPDSLQFIKYLAIVCTFYYARNLCPLENKADHIDPTGNFPIPHSLRGNLHILLYIEHPPCDC